jgi:hypothetical protein
MTAIARRLSRPTSPRLTRLALCLAALVLVLILIFVAIPLRGRAKHRRITDSPFGAYAGYVWLGRVSSVHGAWRVPAIIATSRPGLATTWIGGQSAGISGAFIQVGTAELRGYSPKHVIEDRYWAFWSDRARKFHPQQLFSVKPTDLLSATVSLTGGDWRLTISDATSRKTATLSTEEARVPLVVAQLTQEDALNSADARYTYPSLTPIEIGHLLVNSTVPKYASLYSTWMSINGTYLAPSPLRLDGFLLRPAMLTSAGKHYLALGIGESQAERRFGYELERWTASTSRSALQSATSRLVAVLHSESHALKEASLPPAVKGTATSLARKLDAIIAQAQLSTSPSTFYDWRARLTRDAYEARYIAHLLRRGLGLPELP